MERILDAEELMVWQHLSAGCTLATSWTITVVDTE
jgi:hypothetical protein